MSCIFDVATTMRDVCVVFLGALTNGQLIGDLFTQRISVFFLPLWAELEVGRSSGFTADPQLVIFVGVGSISALQESKVVFLVNKY